MIKLTETAKQICEDNYNSNCRSCPLRPACVQSVGAGQEALDRWVSEINAKAEELAQIV